MGHRANYRRWDRGQFTPNEKRALAKARETDIAWAKARDAGLAKSLAENNRQTKTDVMKQVDRFLDNKLKGKKREDLRRRIAKYCIATGESVEAVMQKIVGEEGVVSAD